MTKDEALRMALEALDFFEDTAICQADTNIATEAITAIKEALANVATNDTSKERVDEMQKQRHEQEPVIGTKTWFEDGKVVTQYLTAKDIYKDPEQPEPVRIMGFDCVCGRRMVVSAEQGVVPAPQRTWVGLTDEEKSELWEISRVALPRYATYASLIEAKLKEKNT